MSFDITQVGSDPIAVDGVPLIIEGEDGVLVDVVGGHDGEAGEPWHVELGGDAPEGLPGHLGEVGEISGVDADAERLVAEVVERHRHGREVEEAAPVWTVKYLIIFDGFF